MSEADNLINDLPEVYKDTVNGELNGTLPPFNELKGFARFGCNLQGDELEMNFPVNCLPKEISEMAKATAKYFDTDVAMPAVASLGVLSICLTGSFLLETIKDEYTETPNLYLLLSAPPSAKKSPVQARMFRPIEREQKQYNEDIKPQYYRYKDKLDAASNTLFNLKKGKPRGMKAGEYEPAIQQAREAVEEIKKHPIKLMELSLTDTTAEGMAIEIKQHDEVMAIVDSEAKTLKIIMGMYSGTNLTDIDIFLKGFAGEPVNIARATKDNIHLDHPLINMCIFTQPSVIDEMLSSSEMLSRGMLQRFLFCRQDMRKFSGQGIKTTPIPRDVSNAYDKLITNFIRTYKENNTGSPSVIKLSDEALTAYDEYVKSMKMNYENMSEVLQEAFEKLNRCCLRFALILHVANGYPVAEPLSLETMKQAIRITKYFKWQAVDVFSDTSQEVLDAQYLVSRILMCSRMCKTSDTISIRDVKHACGKHFKAESDMYAGLDELIDRGYIRMYRIRNNKGGRPSIRVEINPAVYED